MSRGPRRNNSPAVNAEVALAAIQRELPMRELVRNFDVTTNQIIRWSR
jgi:transposase-like protein